MTAHDDPKGVAQRDPAPESDVPLKELYRAFRKPLLLWIGAVLGLWLLSGVVIILVFDQWPARGQFGDLFGAVNSLFSGLAFAGIVVALLLQNHGITLQNRSLRLQLEETTKAHEWNRRKSAHDLVFEASLGRFANLRREVERKINIYDLSQTHSTIKAQLDAADQLNIDAALNFLENVCLAIKNNVVDEMIVYDSLGDILVAYVRWAAPYIKQNRQDISEELWREIDPWAKKWAMLAQERRTALEDARAKTLTQGRGRL